MSSSTVINTYMKTGSRINKSDRIRYKDVTNDDVTNETKDVLHRRNNVGSNNWLIGYQWLENVTNGRFVKAVP